MAVPNTEKKKKYSAKSDDGAAGMIYATGLIGALVYFIQSADSIWEGLLGVLQAIIWPAIVVYKLMESFYG